MDKSFLFLVKKVKGTSTHSLNNSAVYSSNYLNSLGIVSNIEELDKHTEIIDIVKKYKPTDVIIESLWVPPLFFACNLEKFKDIRWYIRLHSDISFLFTETYAMEWIMQYQNLNRENKNIQIASNNLNFVNNIQKALGYNIIYLPNLYETELNITEKNIDNDIIDIGCFGALRQLKNQPFQALSSILFTESIGKTLRFHINATESDLDNNIIFRNLHNLFSASKHFLVFHKWLPHSEFLKLISTMDIGIQLSFNETFNLIVCDFLSQGVPILISDSINWGPDFYRCSSNQTTDVIKFLDKLYYNRNDKETQRTAYSFLSKFLENSKLVWQNFILND